LSESPRSYAPLAFASVKAVTRMLPVSPPGAGSPVVGGGGFDTVGAPSLVR